MPKHFFSRVIIKGSILLLFILVITFQIKYDRLQPPFTTRLTLAKRNLLPEQILPYVSFGFNNVLADFYWIRSIQDFVAWNGKEGFFIGYIKNITTLDPRFEFPYQFAILAIPQSSQKEKDLSSLEQIVPIAKKGIDAIPTSWTIPFYLGTQYYIFTKQYTPAVDYLKIAAERPGSPQGASLLYATFIARSSGTYKDSTKNIQELLKIIYNNTDNETLKKLSGKGIQIQVVAKAIAHAELAYKTTFKKFPSSVEELLEQHFLALPDGFLDDFTVTITPTTGSFRIKER